MQNSKMAWLRGFAGAIGLFLLMSAVFLGGVVFSSGGPIQAGIQQPARQQRTITFVIDGGGSAIATGALGLFPTAAFSCTINRIDVSALQSGSITVDIWKGTIGNFPPTDANTITGSSPLAISGGLTEFDSALTGWTKKINRFNILAFNVDSCSTITRCTVTLHVKRT